MNFRDEIISILSTVKKEGIENIIKFLNESTFFSDPASTLTHNNYEGGLAEHSFNVYKNLNQFCENDLLDYEKYKDSVKIIGLLHDVSLVDTFQKSYKNMPLKDSNGKNKLNEQGKLTFIEKEMYDYNYNNILPYPQGQLSTIIIKKYIKLTILEDLAIQYNQNFINDNFLLNRAQKMSKIILYTFFAEMESKC